MKTPRESGSMMWRNPLRSSRRAGRARPRRSILNVETMESRLCLSSGSAGAHVPAGTGIDAIALGDVNGDQVADVAVANHLNGQYLVSIYGGLGQPDGGLATGYAPELLATIPDPFSPAAGPLDVALGDFSGSGISELAISAKDSTRSRSGRSSRARVRSPMDHSIRRSHRWRWAPCLRPRVSRRSRASTWPRSPHR